ncbi:MULTISPECIES: YdcF family protein [unclassified Paenibacillus]|uniref:Vancomycin high temperature exclusion protein n=1 Tax=Paenibacillus provencensis TaxID=441151 RepID=A0ABW3PPI1_9BACL|nr:MULTISPECIES: YdcF family protein [unclassified Paenibacillus]MCM3126663.1 YdcF family protein [Paenibacillus sp. MER 78]SFS58350.1 protein SanA, affects membrane permeability for vancomycin [Paenibacillus sp. 453mf]
MTFEQAKPMNKRPRETNFFRYAFRILAAVVIIGLIWVVYVQWKIFNPNETTEIADPVDVGIVLGASLWGDEPSPGLAERLDKALELYNAGSFRYFIVTGGLDSPQHRLTEAEGMQRYLVEHGVEASRIFLENEATSTYENLLFSQKIMTDEGLTSSIIITHDFHGMRSLEIAEFLDYEAPAVSLAESVVMPFLPSQIRETLAYTKWKLDAALLFLQ